MPVHLVNIINHRHHHHRSSQTSSSSNPLTHTEAAQEGGHIMSALDTVHWVPTCMTVAMVIELAPHWARPQGQEGRCRCSRGLHLTTDQALAAPPLALQVRTEGAWLKSLPAVLAVCQCDQHLHTTGRGVSPGQSAPSPVPVGLGFCNTEWTRAVGQVSLEFHCCFSGAK